MQCGAKTRSGTPCKSYGMTNGRCRMHGGANAGAPLGNRNAWKHGFYSREELQNRKVLSKLLGG